MLSPKIFFWRMKFHIQKTFGSNEMLCLQNIEKKNSVQNYMDKCHQDQCCLDKCSKHLLLVNLGCMPNFSFLGYVKVGKKDVLRVGGEWVGGWFWVENNATLWLHLASWELPDSPLS